MAIDKRIHYLIVLDTETAGSIADESTFVYDFGWAVCDKRGKVYETKSYIVDDIFNQEQKMMTSAYYAVKLPAYHEQIRKGERTVASYREVRNDFLETMRKYGTKTVVAHNMRFDLNANNYTMRWLTKSKWRYFFPYDTEFWDTMKMARDVVAYTPAYKAWCGRTGHVTNHKTPRPKVTAESLYRYISGEVEFAESHTALEDVLIEVKILAYCFAKHKPMAKGLYEKSKRQMKLKVVG